VAEISGQKIGKEGLHVLGSDGVKQINIGNE
jgi:hypothetical protein